MQVFTDYLWFNTKKRREIVRITEEVASIVEKSQVNEGMVLVSAMHITAGVYVNDWEDGLIHDFQTWLETLAPAERLATNCRGFSVLAVAMFIIVYCAIASTTETGLGDVSPYLLDLTIAASLLTSSAMTVRRETLVAA